MKSKKKASPATAPAKRRLRKFVVWSFDPDNAGTAFDNKPGQVMVDLVPAYDEQHAQRRVARWRPYATVDGAQLFTEHLRGLQQVAKIPMSQLNRHLREAT